MSDLIEQLISTVGPAGYVLGREAIPALSSLAFSNKARLTLRPASTAELSRVMRLCFDAGQRVVPQGGLSGAVQGANSTADEIVLSLERMNRIEELDTGDGTMLVQAGVPLQAVQEAARARGMHFALDLAARGSATIGGTIATNAGGNQVLRYGMAREQVLGLEVVLADGRILSSLNRMLKNNAAYDLKHLFIGSEGTLGIITRAVLRLRAALPAESTALVATDDFRKMPLLLQRMQAALGGQLTSFEAMWRSFYRLACSGPHAGPPPLAPDHPYYLLIEAAGSDRDADSTRFTSALTEALEQELIVDAVMAKSEGERLALWAIRDNMECLAGFSPFKGFDVSLPTSAMQRYLEAVEQGLRAIYAEPKWLVVGHLGDGNLHIVVALGDRTGERAHEVEDAVYRPLAELSGSISGEHGIGLEKREYLHYSRSPTEIQVMRQLKGLLDPKGILNAGKVL